MLISCGNNKHGECGFGDCEPIKNLKEVQFFSSLKERIKMISLGGKYGFSLFLTSKFIYFFFNISFFLINEKKHGKNSKLFVWFIEIYIFFYQVDIIKKYFFILI